MISEPDRQSRVVYGVVLDDDRTATLVRRIMNLSLAVAIFGVLALITGSSNWLGGLSLLIPLCGYYGAKNRNEEMLTAFWLCNLINAFVYIWLAIAAFGRWNTPASSASYGQNGFWLFVAIVALMFSGCQIMMCMWGRELAMTPTFVTTTSANPVVATYSEVVTSPDAEYAELK